MLGVLLESSARTQRRNGGMALSVVTHVALIAAATVATVHGEATKPDKPQVQMVKFKAPDVKPVEVKRTPEPVRATLTNAPAIPTINIVAPTVVPPTLPPINPGGISTPDDFVVTRSGGGATGKEGMFAAAPEGQSTEWIGSEVMMHILAPAKPRYPEQLRNAGVDGSVLVQFTVDTTGRVDSHSIKILQSTHDLFSDAVRSSLGGMRFKPAEVNGKHVPALAQMPFEFKLNR